MTPSSPRRPLLGVGLAALWLVATGCPSDRASNESRPNVVLVTLDTARADYFSYAGHPRPTSPFLDAMAEQSATIPLAYAPTSSTGPSHASLFVGSLPDRHGVRKNGIPLDASNVTIAEVLRANGYHTMAVVSSYVLGSRFGYDQGFDRFDDDFDGEPSVSVAEWEGRTVEGQFDQKATAATDAALALVADSSTTAPWFLWVHYFDPHYPYVPPFEDVQALYPAGTGPLPPEEEIRAYYEAEIHYADREVRRLLSELRERSERDLLEVVLSDHGEGLGQHGIGAHGLHLYDELTRSPLLIRWPGRIPAGEVVETLWSHVDFHRTLAGLLGLSPADTARGMDLSERILGRRRGAVRRVVPLQRREYVSDEATAACSPRKRLVGARSRRWKLFRCGDEFVLYDMEADPDETRDVSREHSQVVAELADQLPGSDSPPREPSGRLPTEVRRSLEALGYVE